MTRSGRLAGLPHCCRLIVCRDEDYDSAVKVEAGGSVRDETAARIAKAFADNGVELLNGGSPEARLTLSNDGPIRAVTARGEA